MQPLEFDEALIQAGILRFRAIFLTSITTVAGLSPLLLEKSRQAQFCSQRLFQFHTEL